MVQALKCLHLWARIRNTDVEDHETAVGESGMAENKAFQGMCLMAKKQRLVAAADEYRRHSTILDWRLLGCCGLEGNGREIDLQNQQAANPG
jgi:hypothetical protein